ncbi:hypothetical protein PUN28_006528 [Cardiocondyla obscurior]|uniref:Uncharacterized protein n=1 Tax=Cardiocondyla obscurior TaxID=286306 RepID=A0AAW2GB05_9HYME
MARYTNSLICNTLRVPPNTKRRRKKKRKHIFLHARLRNCVVSARRKHVTFTAPITYREVPIRPGDFRQIMQLLRIRIIHISCVRGKQINSKANKVRDATFAIITHIYVY